MGRTSNRRPAKAGPSEHWAGVRLLLHIGPDTVEVRIGEEGLRFSDPKGQAPEGVVAWEEALALSLLPTRARRHGARPAA